MAEILLIEDTAILSELYAKTLEAAGHHVVLAETGQEGLMRLKESTPALLLLDLHLPDMNGIEILRKVKAEGRVPAVVVITAYSSINVAVQAMREGANDFLAKPFPIERLAVTVRNMLETTRLVTEVARLKEGTARGHYQGFIGSSPIMQSIYRVIDHLADSKAPVFITGESGTGKEVCAEAIHATSLRRDKPFIALNCAAIPRELIESEVFGHVKGAFTGATVDREGAAMAANGGTLFLDEICEMELPLQTKLLRFLQTYSVTPVGSSKTSKADVRIIAATNRDPLREVEAGRFREDLYYRLHVVPLAMPTLAERDGDVIEIARQVLRDVSLEEGKSFVRLAPEVEQRLRRYDWPGNVRQLQNVIRNIVALNDGTVVTLDMLPPPLTSETRQTPRIHPLQIEDRQEMVFTLDNAEPGRRTILPLWQIERGAIEQAVDFCAGNVPKAAALLEVSPSTIYRKRMVWTGEPESEGHA